MTPEYQTNKPDATFDDMAAKPQTPTADRFAARLCDVNQTVPAYITPSIKRTTSWMQNPYARKSPTISTNRKTNSPTQTALTLSLNHSPPLSE
jgi:hypothetical protein